MNASAGFAPRLIASDASPGAAVAGFTGRAAALMREFGPYMAIELILPGGTLLAVLLWLCRRYLHGDARSRIGSLLGRFRLT